MVRTLHAEQLSQQRLTKTSPGGGPSDVEEREPVLKARERRRVALAALELLEAEHIRRLAEIRRDRAALLAQGQ
jgi:hypothetical protein